MILPIIKYGSSTLRRKAFEIDKGDSFLQLARNMMQTMKNAEGIGLAGPQVGVLKNIFVIDTFPLKEEETEKIEKVYFNPEIIHFNENKVSYNEGCLSIPGINEDVLRPEKIEVRYRDEHFDWHEEILEGIVARVFQHEYDHLQGILFIDRINALRKKMIKNKLQEMKNSASR